MNEKDDRIQSLEEELRNMRGGTSISGHSGEEETLVRLRVEKPPRQVTQLHQQVIRGIENDLSGRGLTLYQGEEGPCMVTIVNSSRIISDINRDLGRVLGVNGDIILVLLTQNANMKVRIEDVRDSRVRQIFSIAVNTRWDTITDSQTNKKSFQDISNYLADQ